MPASKSYNNNVSIYPSTNELNEPNDDVSKTDDDESDISDNNPKSQKFRLSLIKEIQNNFENEVGKYSKARRRCKVMFNFLNGVSTGAQGITVTLGATTLGLTATGVLLPIAIPFATVTVITAAVSAGLSVGLKKMLKKIMKYNELETLANSKLCTVSEAVSRALIDGNISHTDYKWIAYERQKYIQEKSNIRKRNKPSVNIDKNIFLEKGRQQGLKEAEKKIRENLKIM